MKAKVLVIQVENRTAKDGAVGAALVKAMSLIKAQCKAPVDYVLYTNPEDLALKVVRQSVSLLTYAKFEALRQNLTKAYDIIIYIDSDVLARTPDAIDSLVEYITNSHKGIFLSSYNTLVNSGIIALKTTNDVMKVVNNLPTTRLPETRVCRYGQIIVTDEEIWNTAIEDNLFCINQHIDFMPLEVFNTRPSAIFNDYGVLPEVDEGTKLAHYMFPKGKELLIKELG